MGLGTHTPWMVDARQKSTQALAIKHPPLDTLLMDSPLGLLALQTSPHGLVRLHYEQDVYQLGLQEQGTTTPQNSLQGDLLTLMEAYFQGHPILFDRIPLDFQEGTPFQQGVWRCLQHIPHGETRTYGQIAEQLGKPGASRAVGGANRTNPIPIIVPCHRVIGHNGQLTGYGGKKYGMSGLAMKKFLLDLEAGKATPNKANSSTKPSKE